MIATPHAAGAAARTAPRKSANALLACLSGLGAGLCFYAALATYGVGPSKSREGQLLVNFLLVASVVQGAGFALCPALALGCCFRVRDVDRYHTSSTRVAGFHQLVAACAPAPARTPAPTGPPPHMSTLVTTLVVPAAAARHAADLLYAAPLEVSFPVAAAWAGGLGLAGPTYAALALEPVQTLAGHLPAHLIAAASGVLAVAGT